MRFDPSFQISEESLSEEWLPVAILCAMGFWKGVAVFNSSKGNLGCIIEKASFL